MRHYDPSPFAFILGLVLTVSAGYSALVVLMSF